jgi:hypothetical protein
MVAKLIDISEHDFIRQSSSLGGLGGVDYLHSAGTRHMSMSVQLSRSV